jgi:ABC-type multidrug transport system fused ATPase/permease subunit
LGAAAGLQGILDRALKWAPDGSRLTFIVVAILALTICKGLLTYSHSVVSARINSRITHSLRMRVFSGVIDLDDRTLDGTASGRLINLLATDTWHTSDAIGLFVSLIVNLCSILVFASLLVALSWRLTMLVVVGVGVILVALRGITIGARSLGRQGVDSNALMSEHMLDALEGVKVIQMFGLKAHRQMLFQGISAKVRSIYFRLDLLHRAMPPLSEILYIGLLLGVLVAGVNARNSVATVVVFLLVLYRLQPQIRQLDSARLSLITLTSSVEDVMRFCETKSPARVPAARNPFSGFSREIEFHGVSFFYDRKADFALENVSFQIPCGKTTAILGPSGSGKTTLISLLCRFRDPVIGEIRADGMAIHDLDMNEWRSQIAWAGQDTYLFSDTVRENIRYGNLSSGSEEIIAAAVRADADGFIAQLPQGYDTKVGAGGVPLSGGQMQRIALARALLRDPAILILDEATSALDSLSEDFIQQYLREKAGRQTVIVISHRLSTVRYADRVVVLQSGRVADQGSPRELFARRGFLSRLRELQHVE